MRTNEAYGDTEYILGYHENPRTDLRPSLRHSRAHTRAQRERYIGKRMGYYPWHTAPAGLLSKWNGGPSRRRRAARRILNGNRDPRLKRPKYPMADDAA